MFSRDEYTKSLEKGQREKLNGNRGVFVAAQRAALSAQQVVGDQHWDMMLSIMQARLDLLTERREEAGKELQESESFDPEVLIKNKIEVRLLSREIEALEWVMRLPQEVIDQGVEASKLLESIGEPTH